MYFYFTKNSITYEQFLYVVNFQKNLERHEIQLKIFLKYEIKYNCRF